MTPRQDPLAAVTQPDPYPYYARLVTECPFYYDAALGSWVVTSGAAVQAVLTSELCRVRPLAEPIPAALVASPAGDIFGRMVRMLDGARHDAVKQAVAAALATVDLVQVAELSERWTQALVVEHQQGMRHAGSSGASAAVSVYVLGSLLGVPDARLPQLAAWASDFARCLAPGSSPAELERGKAAAGELYNLGQALAASAEDGEGGQLLTTLAQAARGIEPDSREVVVANAVGFLFQTYDATAGLIGQTLRTLLSRPDLRAQATTNPGCLHEMVLEVARYDAPVQNTRRFVARDGVIAGQAVQRGDAILVVLAAANRDPAANPEPELFRVCRAGRQLFSFGAGPHSCPSVSLATTIAGATVARLLAEGVDLAALAGGTAYQSSANVRIPITELTKHEEAKG